MKQTSFHQLSSSIHLSIIHPSTICPCMCPSMKACIHLFIWPSIHQVTDPFIGVLYIHTTSPCNSTSIHNHPHMHFHTPSECCQYTVHCILDIQTYLQSLDMFPSSLVEQNQPYTSTQTSYSVEGIQWGQPFAYTHGCYRQLLKMCVQTTDFVLIFLRAWEVPATTFLIRWPSSQITRSGPGSESIDWMATKITDTETKTVTCLSKYQPVCLCVCPPVRLSLSVCTPARGNAGVRARVVS